MEKFRLSKSYVAIFLLILMAVIAQPSPAVGQIHHDQNGLKTSVIRALSADGLQAKRYEIATVGYNSHHWQSSGSLIVELFNTYFGTGYEKYHISIGYRAGTGGTLPGAELVESKGTLHNARIILGAPYELPTTYGGYVNKGIPILLDVRYYSAYKVRLTYTATLVNELTSQAQIIIHNNPAGTVIPDFSADTLVLDQVNRDQNGLQSSVTKALSADKTQAKRYEIATVGYNSHHWQQSGSIILELFNTYFGTGYEKYHINIGYRAGTGTTLPKAELIESRGTLHNARITLGTPYELSTTSGGYVNKGLPILLDVRYYSAYKVKLTYTRKLVNELTSQSQIVIHKNPTGTDIADFSADTTVVVNESNVAVRGNTYVAGKLGIGTTSSDTELDVNGTTRSKFSVISAGNATEGGQLTLADGGQYDLKGESANAWNIDVFNSRLRFHRSSSGEKVTISDSGNVGIGTTAPRSKLAVNGTITAKEIKVESGWSDFVFDEDYDLASLDKVNSFIRENKHLPNIPSAKEVEQGGLAVSEMLSKQMQKIEEMTLYLIQLKKENDELKERVAVLEGLKNSTENKNHNGAVNAALEDYSLRN